MVAYGTRPMPGGTMVVNADASSSRLGTLGPSGTFVTAGGEAGVQGGSDYQAAVQAASHGADGWVQCNYLTLLYHCSGHVICQHLPVVIVNGICMIASRRYTQTDIDTHIYIYSSASGRTESYHAPAWTPSRLSGPHDTLTYVQAEPCSNCRDSNQASNHINCTFQQQLQQWATRPRSVLQIHGGSTGSSCTSCPGVWREEGRP